MLGGTTPHDPLISPVVLAIGGGLPPLLNPRRRRRGSLRQDGGFAAKPWAKNCRVDVRLEIYPRMWHVWQIFLTLPQSHSIAWSDIAPISQIAPAAPFAQ